MFGNRYPVYHTNIKPKGFALIEIDGQVTDEVVEQVRQVVADPHQRQEMVERNFRRGNPWTYVPPGSGNTICLDAGV